MGEGAKRVTTVFNVGSWGWIGGHRVAWPRRAQGPGAPRGGDLSANSRGRRRPISGPYPSAAPGTWPRSQQPFGIARLSSGSPSIDSAALRPVALCTIRGLMVSALLPDGAGNFSAGRGAAIVLALGLSFPDCRPRFCWSIGCPSLQFRFGSRLLPIHGALFGTDNADPACRTAPTQPRVSAILSKRRKKSGSSSQPSLPVPRARVARAAPSGVIDAEARPLAR